MVGQVPTGEEPQCISLPKGQWTLSSHSPSRETPAGGICQGNVPKWLSLSPASPRPSLGEEKDANSPRFQAGAQDEAMALAGPLGLLWGPQGGNRPLD